MEKVSKAKDIRKLIKVFADYNSCGIQYNNCPCNSCVHNMPENVDYLHIVWLLLLGIRGDYESDMIIDGIKKELNK
tara:strand:- start:291 stop:518 length:228 start_codon:yes stop_codon:yes gene_type:complete